MTIDGIFYKDKVRKALQKAGPSTVIQLKALLQMDNLFLDESQILDAIESLIKNRVVVRSDGKFAVATVS